MRLLVLCLTCFGLTSCLQIEEIIEIMDNGKGKFTATLDMSQLVDMMSAMGGEEFEKIKNEKIDSTITIKEAAKESKTMTAEEKMLIGDGVTRVKMNLTDKEFMIKTAIPFTSLANLGKLRPASYRYIFKSANELQPKTEDGDDKAGDEPDFDEILGVFDYSFSNGVIERKVNAEKLEALINDPKMESFREGAEMGINIDYNISYKLPSAVRKVDLTDAAIISDDKRTVTIKNNILEVFAKPEKFKFRITY